MEQMKTGNKFNKYLNNLLAVEGGQMVDHRGVTNFGISQPTYDAYLSSKKAPKKSVRDVSYGDVKNFYYDEFYTKPQIDKVSDISEGVGGLLFDYSVNAGSSKAIKDLQAVVGAKPDGVIGPKTLASVQKYVRKNGEGALKKAILSSQAAHYDNLITSNPDKYGKFADGWKNRIAKTASLYASE